MAGAPTGAPYDYWPIIRRPRLEWPNGARIAFWVGANIEYYDIRKPQVGICSFPPTTVYEPDPLNYGWRDYGPRVGVWRLMDVLDKYGMRASVLLNSDVCTYYPDIIEEGNRRGWAWLAHGKSNSIFEVNMAIAEERQYLSEMVAALKAGTGQQPRGWLGPALTETYQTPDLLVELGIDYVLDWCNDDQPYPMRAKQGRLISVPYSVELNDVSLFLGKSLTGPDFYQMVVDQFDVLFEEAADSGRVMALCVHPMVINQPFRHKYLDQALGYVAGHEGVWLTTSDEIAAWYYQHYYDQAVAELGAVAVK